MVVLDAVAERGEDGHDAAETWFLTLVEGPRGAFREGAITVHLGDEVSEVECAEEGEVAGF